MAIPLLKRSNDGIVGLDIDGRYLAAAQVSNGKLTRVASAPLPDGILADGEVVDRAALTEALRDFVAQAKLPKRVQLGVSNQQIVLRMLEMPQIEDPSERDSALRFQAAETIAMPLDEAVLDHQVAGYVDGPNGSRMQVVLVAARRTMIDEYLAAVKDAGLKAEGIDLDAFALIRVLAGQGIKPVDTVRASFDRVEDVETEGLEAPTEPLDPYAAPPEPPAPFEDSPLLHARVYCHLGGVTQLAIAVGDACYFTRTLSTAPTAEGAAAAIADEIRLSIDYYMAQPNALAVGDALISGVGARDLDLVADIGALLGIPVGVAEPLGELDSAVVPTDEDAGRYTVAAGLAIGAAA